MTLWLECSFALALIDSLSYSHLAVPQAHNQSVVPLVNSPITFCLYLQFIVKYFTIYPIQVYLYAPSLRGRIMASQVFLKTDQLLPDAVKETVDQGILAGQAPAAPETPEAKRLRLLRGAGLDTVTQWETTVKPRLTTARTYFSEASQAESALWRNVLPNSVPVKDFDYNIPPTDAAEAISVAEALECFDSVVIWTPEAARLHFTYYRGDEGYTKRNPPAEKRAHRLQEWGWTSPMAIGIIKDFRGVARYFPIARWSDTEELKTLDEITAEAAKVDKQMRKAEARPWWLGILATVLVAVGVAAGLWLVVPVGSIFIGVILGAVAGWITYCWTQPAWVAKSVW